MSVTLLVLCIFFSFLFFYLFSLRCLNIIAIDCVILLLHKIMGPEWIFEWFYYIFVWYFYKVLLFMVTHYYVSFVLIFVICIWSLITTILRLCAENEPGQLKRIQEEITELASKIDSVESKLDNILLKLARIESQIN